MGTIIDISGPLFKGMWSYNSLPNLGVRLPEFEVEQVATVERNGFESFRFALSSNTGTYLETGTHMLGNGPALDDLDVSAFIRPAVICHLPKKKPRELIRPAELEAHCPPVRVGDALLIECGWGSHWRSSDYVTGGPSFDRGCLPWLLAQPMAILGVDVPCMQSPWLAPEDTAREHMLMPLFRKGVLLLAPLVNLDRVDVPRAELIALPLKVDGVSGAPCRAVLRLPAPSRQPRCYAASHPSGSPSGGGGNAENVR